MNTCTERDESLTSYCGWIGSKSGQADSILIPRLHPLAYHSIVEVFAGGSAGLFLKKRKATVQNILNDKDRDVITMHEAVAGQPETVMAEMAKLCPSRATFDEIKRLRDSAAWWDLPRAERAAKMIYLIKNSVNGNLRSYSISAKVHPTYNPQYDLRPYAEKFRGVQFDCVDWRDLLERLVFRPREAKLFLYADPPYVVSTRVGYYRHNFSYLEHILFARTLCRINALNKRGTHDVRIMVSYDDDEDGLIRALYRPEFGWWVESVPVKYEADNRATTTRHELVITNYDTTALDTCVTRTAG